MVTWYNLSEHISHWCICILSVTTLERKIILNQENHPQSQTSSCFPFFKSSMATLMLEPCLAAPTTFVCRRNLSPCLVKERCNVLATSRSIPKPPMFPRNSTRVTSAPSRDHTEPCNEQYHQLSITGIVKVIKCNLMQKLNYIGINSGRCNPLSANYWEILASIVSPPLHISC